MRPTVAVSRVEFGAAKLGVFGRLKTSKRNCSLDCSEIWNCLNTEKSTVRKMSGDRMRRPELPYVKLGAATKALVSNQRSNVGLSRLPEAMRFGRCPATPVFATSRDIVTVYGTPLRKMKMPCICQPPANAFTTGCAE